MKITYVSRGLGDTIDKITTTTGIKTVVHKVADAMGIDDCGCEERKAALNKAVPYKTKEENVLSELTTNESN
jgi:hypothetical protein